MHFQGQSTQAHDDFQQLWMNSERIMFGWKKVFCIFIPIPASSLFPDCFSILAILSDSFANMWTSPFLISWAEVKKITDFWFWRNCLLMIQFSPIFTLTQLLLLLADCYSCCYQFSWETTPLQHLQNCIVFRKLLGR